MAKMENQKLKLLYLKDIFEKKTDEAHPVTMDDIIGLLESRGVHAERKSLYSDIRLLREYGMDIQSCRAKRFGYYLGSRDFETAELKLLADAVSASKFIPKTQTKRLIKKLTMLTGEHSARQLNRQVYTEKNTAGETSCIYANIDAVYNAIDTDSRLKFRYFDWNVRKTREFRHGGSYYMISPWALVWNDAMYYLVGYDSEKEEIRHFRVDKMDDAGIIDMRRDGERAFRGFDMDSYKRKLFGMYNGNDKTVKLRCHNSLANLIIDRFGRTRTTLMRADDEHFDVFVQVSVSPVFLSWAAGFGDKLVITSPSSVRDELKKMLLETLKAYE